MATIDMRFAGDEKSLKNLAPALVGREMSYWEDNQLRRGRVKAADLARDRYGNPFIQVEIDEEKAAASGT